MKKRILSILLVLVMLIGLMPQNIAFAADYERWGSYIRIGYDVERDSWAWETYVDYDDPSLPREYNGELPAGVAFDEETNTLTLTDVSLTNVEVNCWSDNALNIVISGEVCVTGELPEAATLQISNSSAVTVSGASGDRTDKLILSSTSRHALNYWGYVPFTEGEGYGELADPNARLTVKDLTLEATSDYSGNDFSPSEEGWMWTAIMLNGGASFENVALTARGYNGIEGYGNISFDGCTVTAPTASFGELKERNYSDEPTNTYESRSQIKDTTFMITANGHPRTEDYSALLSIYKKVLTIDGKSNVTIDADKAPAIQPALVAAGYYDQQEQDVAAGIHMKGGALNIKLQNGDDLEGIVEYFDPVRFEGGANWIQTGGDVTVTVNADEYDSDMPLATHAVTVGDGASFHMQGGTFTIDNQSGEDVFYTGIMALTGWEDSSLSFTGGTFTATGAADKPYDVALWVYDEMTVTGDAVLNLKGTLQTETMGSHIQVFGGEVNIDSHYRDCVNIGSALSVYGGKMNLNAIGTSDGIFTYQGHVRFLGGEVNVSAGYALRCYHSIDQFTFGEGVKAAFSDGTEATLQEMYVDYGDEYGESFEGWATGSDRFNPESPDTVTIKKQGVKSEKASLAFEITNTTALVTGVPVNFRIIPTLTSASDTLTVALPDTMILGGVTVNNQKVEPVITAEGMSIAVNNGDIVRITAIADATGEVVASASVGDVSAEVSFTVESFTLSVPSAIKYPSFTVFGSSAPGSTVTFFEKGEGTSRQIGSLKANAAGAWKAELCLEDVAGPHTIYAEVMLDGKIIATSGDYVVTYDDTRAVVETLTITNTIHGTTSADSDQEVSVILNYVDGTRSQNYYIYWPELPEFRFEVKFAGEKCTPADISDVAVIATDRLGESTRVALTYDASTGLWCGMHEFCNYGNIVPDKFSVVWREAGASQDEEENTGSADMPFLDEEPEEYYEDHTTDVVAYVEPGQFALPIAGPINGVTDITGADAVYTVTADTVTVTVEPGEMYIIDAVVDGVSALTGQYEGNDRLILICSGDNDESVELCGDVISAPAEELVIDDTSGTFTSDRSFAVGDVIQTGDGMGIVVTEADGDSYTFRNADIGDIYETLDVSSMDTDDIKWEVDEEAVVKQFKDSPLFESYKAAIEVTLKDEAEIKGHKVDLETTAHADSNGVVSIDATITVTTDAETKRPKQGKCETTISATFFFEIEMDNDYRIRFEKDNEEFSLYYAATATKTIGFDINVGINAGAGAGSGMGGDDILNLYFEELKEDAVGNFLEKLGEAEKKGVHLTFAKLNIPTPVAGVEVYVEPSFELNWGFFGELVIGAEVTSSDSSGFTLTYLDGQWNFSTFGNHEAPQVNANATIHSSAFIEGMLRVDAGVSILRFCHAGLYAKVGPRVDLAGHGTVSYPSMDRNAELTARVGFYAEIGARAKILLWNKVGFSTEDIKILDTYKPLGSVGWGEMPTQFDVMEGPEPLLKPKKFEIVDHISLNMRLQTFGDKGSSSTKVYSENNYERYSFEVTEGPAHIEGTGANAKVVVDDPTKPCTYWIRATYQGNNYELYKSIPLRYEPGYIEVFVSAEEEPPIASIEIRDLEDSSKVYSGSTDANGYLIMNVPEGTYSVAQVSPPAKNELVSASPVQPVKVSSDSPGSASFANKKPPEKKTNDFPLPDIGDPSGYVYEGIVSNRLEGVKTTLFYKPTEDSDEITVWDASAFDQKNPLFTDAFGQYLWMVPSGWWQVKYELDGYTTAQSEWMEVPPIRTGVNVNLTSTLPAEAELEYSDNLLLRFSRPVKLSTLSGISIRIDGELYEVGYGLSAFDDAWSVTEDPSQSTLCATVFELWIDEDVAGKQLEIILDGVETYNGISGTASITEDIPADMIEPEGELVCFVDADANLALTVLDKSAAYGYMPATEVTVTDTGVEGLTQKNLFGLIDAGDNEHVYIMDCYGRYLYMKEAYNSFNVSAEIPEEGALWKIEAVGDDLFTVFNVATGKTIGFNSQYNTFGAYPDASLVSQFVVAPWGAEEPDAPMIGDFTDDGVVDNQDVEHLLWHTLFPEDYPINQSADYTGDDVIDNQDVEYILWYTLFPEDYPLR